MKRLSIVVLLTLLMWSLAVSQTRSKRTSKGQQTRTSAAKVEQALKELEHQWAEAFKNRDKAALDRILDERFVFTDDEGQVFNKTQYVEAVMQAIKVEAYSVDDLTTRLYGDTGVVTGRWTGKMTIEGKDGSGAFRFTDTFVRRLDRWRVIASQDTRIPQKGGKDFGN